MSQLLIIGDKYPETGKETKYSLSLAGLGGLSNNISVFNPISEIPQWQIFVLENGKWRKTSENTKQGESVSYTFKQSSLSRQGIKIVVTKGNERGELIIKTKKARQPKILKIDLLDANYHKITKPLHYFDTLIAKAQCTDMEGEKLHFTLWEDDALKEGHNKMNEINKINPVPISATVKRGKAEARFNMAFYTQASMIANMQLAKGDKSEGKNHEYYVTADYYGKSEASNNVNIKAASSLTPIRMEDILKKIEADKLQKQKDTQKQKVNKRPTPPRPAPKKDTYKTPITPKATTKAADAKGKILSVEFVNFVQQPLPNVQFGVPFYAKVRSNGMKGKTVKLKIWEDDAISDELVHEENVTLVSDVCFIKLTITDKMREKGGDLFGQQYYLEIEHAAQSVDSNVLNVNDSAPKIKVETGVSTSGVGRKKREEQKKEDCFCNKDFQEKDVRKLVKLLKGFETIWEGQALKGGKRAECNISDKSFATLTKELNTALKKYKINTCAQKMHFLAQVCEETGTFSLSEETKSNHTSSKSAYKGRGLLQLTGVKKSKSDEFYNEPGPYQDYADHMEDQKIVTKPEIVANNVHYCIDSGAWIWSINKRMPKAPSGAVDRWGAETSGKSLNELAVYVDKYLELISVLLNGRGSDDMPNGWAIRKSNYNTLKNFFFMYDKYHGDNNKPVSAKDIVTYHIYANGEIERHIPKEIKSGYEQKYKYVYHDVDNKEHEICIANWLEIDKVKREKPNPLSIPRSYISHESFNIQGVNQKDVYKYSDGTVIASGDAGEGGGTIRVKFIKSGGKTIIVKVPEPLSYSSGNVKVNLKFENTIRTYMGRDHFAALIGALAECGLSLVSEGSAMKDGTCFPSISHTNGESIDTDYLGHVKDQKFINAMIKFGFTNILHHPNMTFKNPNPQKAKIGGENHHKAHLHCGTTKINVKEKI